MLRHKSVPYHDKSKTQQLLDQARGLEELADAEMRRDYPIGSTVYWTHGEREQSGVIVDHGYLHVFARTEYTARRRIDVRRVREVFPPPFHAASICSGGKGLRR